MELTVIGARPELGDPIAAAATDDAALVISDGTTYLVYQVERDGRWMPVRAEVDTDSVPVMRALGLEGALPRRMSAGLLNAFPLVEPLAVPQIPGAGRPGMAPVSGVPVGSCLLYTSPSPRD